MPQCDEDERRDEPEGDQEEWVGVDEKTECICFIHRMKVMINGEKCNGFTVVE